MNIIFKLVVTLFLILPFDTFAGIFKNSNIAIDIGLAHTGFDYINSEPYFTNKLHTGPSIGIAFKYQFWKYLGCSAGLNYCVLGGKKYFSYSDSIFQYDSSSMVYQYISTGHFEGSFAFNFKYVSLPVFLTCKIANLPLEAALGSSFGYIINQERGDYRKGRNGETRVGPVNKKAQFHSRLSGSIQYNIIKTPLNTNIGFLYSHELIRITSILTSRGIQNTNEFRLYLSVSFF